MNFCRVREEHLKVHANLASVPVAEQPVPVIPELSVFVTVIVSETTEGSPYRSVFEIGRFGNYSFNLVYLLLLLGFDCLVSKDLIFRHVKVNLGVEGESTGWVLRVGVELLSTRLLSTRLREKHVNHALHFKNPHFLGKSGGRTPGKTA